MKTQQQHQHPEIDPQLLAITHRAINILDGRKKSSIKIMSERTKQLRHLASVLVTATLDADADGLFRLPVSVDPRLIELAYNPEEGL
jgi:hypothetical protein